VDLTRPVLDATAPVMLTIGAGGRVVIEGLVVVGAPLVLDEVADNERRTILLRDCTLVPGIRRNADGSPQTAGTASLLVLDATAVVRLERCITGPIVAVDGARVTAVDSVLDSDARDGIVYAGRAPAGGLRTAAGAADQLVGDGLAAGGGLRLKACTVIGGIHADVLDASNSLLLAALPAAPSWPAAVWARRRQQGCVRFSWLPDDSRTGQRFHCLPAGAPGLVPVLTSSRFGDPGYCQLEVTTPGGIRRGADDESEMGVTHGLFTPQREANLRIRLAEYLRFGLEAGFCYAS
jgi:hypothetical protein